MPRNSYYSQAVSLDPEHAKMLVRARDRAKAEGKAEPFAPPMATWSAEVDMQARILDAIHSLNYTLTAVNSAKGKTPKPPQPFPRPRTALDRATHEDRKAKHEALVARVLPHKAKKRP